MKTVLKKSIACLLVVALLATMMASLTSCVKKPDDSSTPVVNTTDSTTDNNTDNNAVTDKDDTDENSDNKSDSDKNKNNNSASDKNNTNKKPTVESTTVESTTNNVPQNEPTTGESATDKVPTTEAVTDITPDNAPTTGDSTTEKAPDNEPTTDSGIVAKSNYYLVKFGYPDSMTEADKSVTYYPNEQLVPAGELVYILPTPTREGYTFSGWYYDSDLSMVVAIDDVVNENMTLYPKMVPAEEAEADLLGDGSINYVSAIDVGTDYRVTVKAPSAEAVKEGLSFMAVSDGNVTVDFTVADNGDGTFTINPVNGIEEGKTYQLYATDREKGIEADGRVPSDDEYVLFIHNGEVQRKEIRYYNIFTSKEEVYNLRIDDQVKFIDFDNVTDFGMQAAAGLYTASIDESGEISLTDNAASGTFIYEGDLEIGEIVAIHDGNVNEEERTIEDGDVAYIEITARDGYVYSYVSAKAEDVMFLPDVIPVSVLADMDTADNTITVLNEILDFTYFENQEALNKKTSADVDDYLAIYEGKLGEAKTAEYAKITKVQRGDKTTTITYVPATLEEIQNSLDTYTINSIDMTMAEVEIEALEEEIQEQAIESGFAEQSAQYMVQSLLETEEEIQWGEVYPLSDQQAKKFGIDVEAGSLLWQVRLDPPDIKANITTKLQKVTQVNKATGLRVDFGVTIPIGLELVENGTRVVESYYLDLYVTFEQEVAFNTRFSADVEWDNFLYIVWWISDVTVDAGFEMGTYTGVGAIASVYTEKYQAKSYIWNELVEDTDGGAYSSASSISKRLNEMLKDGNTSFFEGKNGASLADEYEKMLEREVDYVDILVVRLYHTKNYFDPKTRLVNYVLDVELVLGAKLNVTTGVSFENLTVKQFSFHMNLFDATATANVVDKQTPYANFNFFIMGNLGIRAGVRVTFSVGLISVKLDNLGAMAEVGLFLDLYGFFYFHYDWNGATNKHNVQSGGGLYAEFGIYMDLDLFGGVLFDLASFTVHLFEKEWKLWDSGNRESIVAPYQSEQSVNMNGESFKVTDYYLRMISLDVKTGKRYPVYVPREHFTVKNTNPEKFTYNHSTGVLEVTPEQTDIDLSTSLIFTYNKETAVFSAQPLTITIDVKWEKTKPYNAVYFSYLKEETDEYLHYSVMDTYRYLEGSPITGLPRNLTTTRPGYDFVDWKIRSDELPEYDGKLLSEVNYLEGVLMPSKYISLVPVWKPRDDVKYTLRHHVQSIEDPTKYEVVKEDVLVGTPGSKFLSEVYDYLLDSGYNTEMSKWPMLFDFTIDGKRYIQPGFSVRGDGTSVIDFYYTRDQYMITFNVNNPDYEYYYEDSPSYSCSVVFGEALPEAGFDSQDIPGYTFKGWSTSSDGSTGIIEKLPETVSYSKNKNIVYYAIWEGAPTEYTINYYIQKPDGEYDFIRTEERTATVGDKFNSKVLAAEDKTSLDGAWLGTFTVKTADGVAYKKAYIDDSEGLVIDAYYYRTYYKALWDYTDVDYYWSEQIITFPEVEKEGYVHLGWESDYIGDTNIYKPGDTMEMPRYDLYFTSVYAPATETPYTVKHIRQDVNGSYESADALVEIENLTGTTDSRVTPAVKEYVGFESPVARTVTIAADGSTEVVYHYARKTYSIYIQADGGRVYGTYKSSYTFGEAFYLTDGGLSFAKAGYNFAGLYIQGDETKTPLDEDYLITGDILESDKDITFVVLWEDATYEYKVEHYLEDLEGGFVLQQTDKFNGGYMQEVTAVSVEFTGFTFDETMEGTVKSGVIESETETLVLKLYYTRNSYEAKWYDYDKVTLLATESFLYQEEITLPEGIIATREGYTLDGWDLGNATMTTEGASFNACDNGFWTANTYSVIFVANGAEGTMNNQQFTYDEPQTLSPNSFIRDGYVFAGWSTQANGEVIYNDQEQVNNLATDGTVQLYAQWVAGVSTAYTVEYYGENLEGTGYELLKTENHSGTTDASVQASAITFEGFAYDEANAENLTSGTILGDGSLVLKLYYTRNSYNLTFDFNGESMKQAVDGEITGFEIEDAVVSVKYGASVADEIAKLTVGEYAGYTFGGWGEYPETMVAENLTVTAVWTPITITVTYYPGASWYNSTTTATETVFTYKYGDEIATPDVEFTAEGYDIAGWVFHSGDGGPGQYPILTGWPLVLVYNYHSSEYFCEGNTLDLSPFWSNAYTAVAFNSNGGIGTMDAQLVDRYSGGGALNKNKFTKEGYRFVGWNTEANGSGDAYADTAYFTPVDESGKHEVILYAQWEEII